MTATPTIPMISPDGAARDVPAAQRLAYDRARASLAALLDPVRTLASNDTAKVD